MRITELRIDNFGVWRDLSLPLADSGISLIYGPNEAGKSTLMRFIRGMLYGFCTCELPSYARTELHVGPRSEGPWVGLTTARAGASASSRQTHRPTDPQTSSWKGALRITSDNRAGEIQRTARPGERGTLSITGFAEDCGSGSPLSALADQSVEELLTRLLSSTSESVFRRLFSVDLQELHELATLDDEELAGFIYGLTLGPEGQRILDAADEIERRRSRIFCAERNTGSLVDLLRRDDELSAEIRSAAALRDRHAAMLRRRDELATRIDERKARQAGLRQSQRGHRYLQQAWPIWNRMREIRAQLDKLPVLPNFPADGLERLRAQEVEIEALTDRQRTLFSEARELREQAGTVAADLVPADHVGAMRQMIAERDRIVQLNQKTAEAEARVDEAAVKFDEAIGRLGPEWSAERLESIDVSAPAQCRLIEAAGEYRSALATRSRVRRRYKRRSIVCRQKAAEWKARLKSLGHSSSDDLAAETKQPLAAIEELVRLRVREAGLEQRRVDLDERLIGAEENPAFPTWTYVVLGCFGVLGIVFASIGFYTGLTANVVVGLMYAFLGATFGGTAFALKLHAESPGGADGERLQDELRAVEIRLRESREALARLMSAEEERAPASDPDTSDDSDGPSFATRSQAPVWERTTPKLHFDRSPSQCEAELRSCAFPSRAWERGSPLGSEEEAMTKFIARRAQSLAELEQLAYAARRIQSGRRQLGELREKLRSVQRDASAARASWCEFLKQIGLDETVRIDEAFAAAGDVLEAKSARESCLSAQRALDDHRRTLEEFRQSIASVAERAPTGTARRVVGWSGWHDLGSEDPVTVLDLWKEQLDSDNERRAERRRLLREAKARRRKAVGIRRKIAATKTRRAVLLAQAGIDALSSGSRLDDADRRDFERRVESTANRRKLEAELEAAAAELQAVSGEYPDLAVVEEDMLDFDPDRNAEQLREVDRELGDVENEIQQLFEQLGGVKREIAEAESDRRATRLRFDRARLRDRIRQTAEDWLVLCAADRAVDAMRRQFERKHQPATLAAAAKYLRRMTSGRYRNVWTPLGQRRLCVDDERGRSFSVEQLSGGTREQLFLAIRLALVDEFRARGVELPMVLDDVLANFDQTRTEAAVDTLLEFAAGGQQVLLLTCHLHLANLFDSCGLNPNWLPVSEPAVEERKAG